MTTTIDTRSQHRAPNAFVPRHNIEAEEALIGAILLSVDALVVAADVVTSGDFYRPSHQAIFHAVHSLFERGQVIDPITVHEELLRGGVGNLVNLAELFRLQMNTPSSSNAVAYADVVLECAKIRRLDAAASEVRDLARDATSATVAIDRAEHLIFEVSNDERQAPAANSQELATVMLREALEAADHPGELRGLSIGFADLDLMLRGLRPGQFCVIGARPSIGKTAFGLSIALANAQKGIGVLFCSLEMSRDEIALRLGSMLSGVDHEAVASGSMTDHQWTLWQHASRELATLPLWVDDDPGMDIFRVKARARRRQREGLGLIVVDYLQLMATPEAENRQVAVSALSRSLKLTAKQLGVPILALSQLSRALEARLNKKPVLADLRESGSLEQDADVVILLSRDQDPSSLRRGVLEVDVAKNRSGRCGSVDLAWRAHVTSLASVPRGDNS